MSLKDPIVTRFPAAVCRFIALDVHKKYLVATGVDRELNQVFGHRVATNLAREPSVAGHH